MNSTSEDEYNTDDERGPPSTPGPGSSKTTTKSAVRRKQKYKSDWEQIDGFKLWLSRDKDNVYNAKCTVCSMVITAERAVLERHRKSLKHTRKMAGIFSKHFF